MSTSAITQTVTGDRNIFTATGDVNVVYNLPQADPEDRRGLLILLDKVQQFWVESVLEQSVQHEALISLGKETKADAIEHPWEQVMELPNAVSQRLAPDTTVADVFEQVGRLLLVLGEPGSGKTITLLELARDLVARARSDPSHPVPVVFNLSSWNESFKVLYDWMVEELKTKYFIPKRKSHSWLDGNRLLLLLDGLDEVQADRRAACIRAINAFLEDHGTPGLAVCSRLEEYMAEPVRLKMNGAICLQPLTVEQVARYVSSFGSQLEALGASLSSDAVLGELAKSPLMLSVMTLAYQESSASIFSTEVASTAEARRLILDTYVDRMFARKSWAGKYNKRQVIGWLTWLARSLMHNNLSIFLMEWMQPDWLQSRAQQSILVTTSIITAGLVVGLLHGLAGGVVGTLVNPLADGVVGNVVPLLSTALALGVIGLIVGLGCALVGGLISMLGIRLDKIAPAEVFRWSWKKARRTCRRWLVFGLVLGLIIAVINVLVALVVVLSKPLEGVPLADTLGILVSMGLVVGPIWGLSLGIPLGLVGALIGGFTSDEIVARAIPNEGIRRSLRNAFVSYIIGGLIGGMVGGLLGLLWGLIPPDVRKVLGESPTPLESPALEFALGLGFIVGLISGLRNGGFAYVKHYVLRFLLWRYDYAPLNYVRFLDYAAERVFLRKVGGGYIFIHRILMEYFATLRPTDQAR